MSKYVFEGNLILKGTTFLYDLLLGMSESKKKGEKSLHKETEK
jgi:hypothetical protein